MNKDNFLENLGSIWDGIEKFIDLKVNEKFEEIGGRELSRVSYLNSTLNTDELCKRWDCCKNTLLNMEKEGTLSPLPLKGKRKIYLMSDIVEIEMRGRIKGVYKLVG